MKRCNVGSLTALLVTVPILLHCSDALVPPNVLQEKSSGIFHRDSFEKRRGGGALSVVQQHGPMKLSIRSKNRRGAVSPLKVAEVSEADERKDTPEVKILDNPVSKFRKLKDIMWIREATEDLTAAEFACSVESEQEKDDKKKKRAVDYEKLLSQLDRRVGDMICLPFEEINGSQPEILENQGMGRFAYSQEQRVALLK